MHSRRRYLLLCLLAGLCGAAFELRDVAAVRPWTAVALGRAALEMGGLWIAATLGLALLEIALRRDPAPISAWLVAPMAWSIARLLVEIDPRGQLSTSIHAVIGLVTLAVVLALRTRAQTWLESAASRFAPFRWLAHPAPWLLLLATGVGAAAWTWKRTTPQPAAAPAAPAASVLWISLDTLRADRLGAYGSARGLTPCLDALAREGVVFTDATCPMPLTAPSHTAMLTGQMPHESGVHRNGMVVPRSTESLPRLLGREGYLTAGFVSGFPLFERSSHLASHFHHYDDEFDPHAPLSEGTRLTPFGQVALRLLRKRLHWREPIERAGDATVDRTLAWLDAEVDAAPGARPFFAFCHLYDVHAEYVPHSPGQRPSPFFDAASSIDRLRLLDDPTMRASTEELYDGEVRFVDAQVGRLLDRLRARGMLERTLVLVTSDHGESLGEHDYWYEHINPYHVETHVPLILRLPRGEKAGTRVDGPAQLTDLPATVRDLLGLSLDVPGASLVGAIESGRIPRRLVCCQSMFDLENAWCAVSVRDGRFKLLRRSASFERYDSRRNAAVEQLFDLSLDPGELHDLIAAGAVPEVAHLDELRARLDEFEQSCLAVGPDRIDPEVAENLRRLGYGK